LNTPENNRFGRFIAVIRNEITYNISFVSEPPINMQFKLQKRTISGNKKNFVTLNIRYNLPNSIRAQVNGIKMKPIALINGNLSRPLNTSLCGDNIFFYDNSSISFVVTEDSGCLVKIFLTDSIRLTTHFAMNISEFFSNSVATSFINNLCALLKIKDTSRVKIVGIYAGSIAITTFIESEKVAEAVIDENGTVITNTTDANSSEYSNTTDNASITVSMADTSARLISAIQDGSFAADMQAALGSTVLSAESTFSVVPTFSETNSFSSGELK
jgi:hypothetical protein